MAASELADPPPPDSLSTPSPGRRMKRKRGRPSAGRSRLRACVSLRRDSQSADTHPDAPWYEAPPVTTASAEPEAQHEEEVVKSEEELQRLKTYHGFSDIVVHFPVEIYRSTMFIRAMDEAYRDKTRALDALCRQLKQERVKTRVPGLRRDIMQLMKDTTEARAEAHAEVAKLQTMVESHISLLRSEVHKITDPSEPVVPSEEADPVKPRAKKAAAGNARAASAEEDIMIDDDEPTYCYCQRVSFGKMIACENTQCEGGEWFHFDCLGWSYAPRGKWWCRVCVDAGLASKHFTAAGGEHVAAGAAAETRKKSRRSRG